MNAPADDPFESLVFRNAQAAFEEAIAGGRLSRDPAADSWAGYYFYMGTRNGINLFKHKVTREYLN